jgi:hypothetical protein
MAMKCTSSGMWCRAVLWKFNERSEERTGSIFKSVTSAGLHCVIFQKTIFPLFWGYVFFVPKHLAAKGSRRLCNSTILTSTLDNICIHIYVCIYMIPIHNFYFKRFPMRCLRKSRLCTKYCLWIFKLMYSFTLFLKHFNVKAILVINFLIFCVIS